MSQSNLLATISVLLWCICMALYNLYIYLYINLYSAPSRQLLRGAPSPGSAKQESLEEFIKRTGTYMQQSSVVDWPAGTPGKIPVGWTTGAGDIWAARAAST